MNPDITDDTTTPYIRTRNLVWLGSLLLLKQSRSTPDLGNVLAAPAAMGGAWPSQATVPAVAESDHFYFVTERETEQEWVYLFRYTN